MFKFLIVTLPVIGHVNPAQNVVGELVKRGHDVWWYTGRAFQTKVEATGARFVPFKAAIDFGDGELDKYFPERAKLKGVNQLKFDMKHVFLDSAPEQLKDLKEILQHFPANVIMSDLTMAGPRLLHEKGESPLWVTFGHIPFTFSSVDTAPFGLGILPKKSAISRLRNRVLNKLVEKVVFKDVLVHTNKTWEKVGLAPHNKLPTDLVVSPYLFLQGTVPGFEYPRRDLPQQVQFVGPFLPPPPAQFTPPVWWSELKAGRPVVHVTQGTLATDAAQLLRPAIEALADQDVLVVATTGGQPVETLGMSKLPDNVRVESFIPHYHLLPHVDVMITNGGYNGVQLALANGVPLVAAGTSEDKPEVCNRIAWTGAGINLKTQTPSQAQIRQAVHKILTETSYKEAARKLQSEFEHYNAPARSADLLEKLVLESRMVDKLPSFPES